MKRAVWLVCAVLTLATAVACSEDDGAGAADCDTSEQTTDSGLVIRDVECGEGVEASTGDILTVHYTGELEDGTAFGSSTDGDPIQFQLGSGMVLRGWDEGLVGLKVGGTRLLTIPPELGYGEAGMAPDIPPNATLIFEVELIDISEP